MIMRYGSVGMSYLEGLMVGDGLQLISIHMSSENDDQGEREFMHIISETKNCVMQKTYFWKLTYNYTIYMIYFLISCTPHKMCKSISTNNSFSQVDIRSNKLFVRCDNNELCIEMHIFTSLSNNDGKILLMHT